MLVYKIVNNITGKTYVGITSKKLSHRIAKHIKENKSYIQKALNKYGLSSFIISVIDTADNREILCKKERYWISILNCKTPNGYNQTDGGDGLINPSKEIRKRMEIATRGKRPDRTGTHHTAEAKEKNRLAHVGKSCSTDLHKKKASAACIQRWTDPKCREKTIAAMKTKFARDGHHMYGKHHSNATKRKMSDSYWRRRATECI
jgi:group I intron endonuclease